MSEPRSKLLASLFAERRALAVSELTACIKEMLEAEFFDVYVQGEISNYKRHTSGHWYFTLKDSGAQLRAVYFRQWNRLLRFEPENGLEVRARGRLTVYGARGEYELLVETLEPVGVGSLQLAFEQQVKRLAAEGLFDESRKRRLPLLPRRIGIVTSTVGAALRDMLQILERRNPGIHIIIAPVRVQGAGAAAEIVDAIRLLNQRAKQRGREIDVIIVARGGGSIEDLWAFNEEQVARAIFASAIPVVSAVGHETDFTIADFVADLRAPTPSAAAELVAAEASELRARLDDLRASLSRAMNYYLLRRRAELRELTESHGFAETARAVLALSARRRELRVRAAHALKNCLQHSRLRLLDTRRRLSSADFRAPLAVTSARLEALKQRSAQAMQMQLERARRRLAVDASKLDSLSPLAVLGRGYALVMDERSHVVSCASALDKGQEITLRFEDGEARCQVLETSESPLRLR
jgi:exodeoxyribonuclease VII large subunit